MQQQKVAAVLNAALKKRIVRFAAAVHNDRLVAFFTTAKQEKRFLFIEVLSHLIKEIESQSIDVKDLFRIRKNEFTDSFLLFDKLSGPTNRHVRVHVLGRLFPKPPFAQLSVGFVDQLIFFDQMNDTVRR